MQDIYVAASPAPSLFIYPSSLHAAEPELAPRIRGGRFYEWLPGEPLAQLNLRPRRDEEVLVNALLGTI